MLSVVLSVVLGVVLGVVDGVYEFNQHQLGSLTNRTSCQTHRGRRSRRLSISCSRSGTGWCHSLGSSSRRTRLEGCDLDDKIISTAEVNEHLPSS